MVGPCLPCSGLTYGRWRGSWRKTARIQINPDAGLDPTQELGPPQFGPIAFDRDTQAQLKNPSLGSGVGSLLAWKENSAVAFTGAGFGGRKRNTPHPRHCLYRRRLIQ